MSEHLSLNEALFAEATPAGAYYAVASPASDPGRKLLANVLKEGYRSPLNEDRLLSWSGAGSADQAMQYLYRLQKLDFIHGTDDPRSPPDVSLEILLPNILGSLSDTGRALLADDNGFYLAATGFLHEAAEEIAALAGDILTLSTRHALLLKNNLNIGSSAWAISDPNGQSELGFYPLHVGRQAFILIVGGSPRLQGDDFVTLIQALSARYS